MDQKAYKYTLSIITVTYNAEKELEKTISSILSQEAMDEINIEYIIQDGLSKDRTLNIAREYQERFEKIGISFHIYSEKDSGIYDAMNKGIKKAKGKWVCLLNAGDTFCNERSIFYVAKCLKQSSSDILYADYNRVNSYVKRTVEISQIEELKHTMIFCHQAIFVRNYVYTENLYDCRYKLVADYDLMLRLYLNGYKFEHFPVCLVDYDINGISGTNMIETYREIYKVRKNNHVLGCVFQEKTRYVIGILKRIILAKMPQKMRWQVYGMIKRKNIVKH